MKKALLLIAAATFSTAAFAQTTTQTTKTPEDRTKAGEVIHDAKRDVAVGADKTGHAVKKGAEATGHAVKKGAHATGHFVSKEAHKTAHATKRGARAVGNKAEDVVN